MRLAPFSRSLVFAALTAMLLSAASLHGEPQAASKSRAQKRRFNEYQVPAGTTLPIALRTPLSSNGNRPADAIEGRLQRPLLTRDGVELVPAGAPVLGTISEAEPAGVKQRGRLAFTFQVVEHPDTGSRAMIKATVLAYESEIPVKGNVFSEIRLERGADASVLLLAPLVVRIPTN